MVRNEAQRARARPLTPRGAPDKKSQAMEPPLYDFEKEFNLVVDFLKKEGLDQHVAAFKKAHVGPSELSLLTDAHLKEMGIAKVAHRIRLLNSCKTYKYSLPLFAQNHSVITMTQWYWRPVVFARRYKVTMSAIEIDEPDTLTCTYRQESVNISQITDVNMREWLNHLGIIIVETTNPRFLRLRITLKLDAAVDTFNVIRNLWEEDQERTGKRAAVA